MKEVVRGRRFSPDEEIGVVQSYLKTQPNFFFLTEKNL
jgi:hypothetical protein